MAITLDLKDRKILYELDRNCRQSNAEIARKVGLSKQVVGFRIQKLIENKVISFFYAVIDISKLGFTIHKNFLRLQNITKDKEKEFMGYAKKNPDVVWSASCDGLYDFIFSTWAKDPEYLNRVLKNLNNEFGSFIYERQTATILRGQYFSRDYLLNRKRTKVKEDAFFGAVPHEVKLDDTDWNILLCLGENARMPIVDISDRVKLGVDAVSDRIKRMENFGVINHYTIVPNESVFPYLHYKILVSLKNNSDEIERRIVSYCKSNSNIVYIVKALGQWDFEIDIEVENVEKFREIMMDFKSEFQNDIKDYSSLNLYQVHKYNFCPSVHRS